VSEDRGIAGYLSLLLAPLGIGVATGGSPHAATHRWRYEAHWGRRSSEDRFVHRVRQAFPGDVAAMFYGAWGAQPNLKHQPPSPGIGLRRRLAAHFPVYVTPEPNTSSVCPHCKVAGTLTHAVRERRTEQGAVEPRELHHLLRCSRPRCRAGHWHRDVLGMLNILEQGWTVLRTGGLHPLFSYRAVAAAG